MSKQNHEKTAAMTAVAAAAVAGGVFVTTNPAHADTVKTNSAANSQTQMTNANDFQRQSAATHQALSAAQTANTKAQDDLSQATSANDQVQTDLQQAQAGVDTATKAEQTTAQAQSDAQTKAQQAQQAAHDAQTDLTQKQGVASQAQQAVDTADQTAKTAADQASQAQALVNQAQQAVKNAQAAVDAVNDHQTPDSVHYHIKVNADWINLWKQLNGRVDVNNVDPATRAKLDQLEKSLYQSNQAGYVSDPALAQMKTADHMVNGSLDPETQLMLTRFVANLLNDLRAQLGTPALQISQDSLKDSTRIADQYSSAHWLGAYQGHDLQALGAANGAGESMDWTIAGDTNTAQHLPTLEYVFNDAYSHILGMLFDDESSADMHTTDLLGLRGNGAGLTIGVQHDNLNQIHINTWANHDSDNYTLTADGKTYGPFAVHPDNSAPVSLVDDSQTSLPAAQQTLQNAQTAFQQAQAKLNAAQAAKDAATKQQRQAHQTLAQAQTDLSQAETAFKTAQAQAKDAQDQLTKLTGAGETIQQATAQLNAANDALQKAQAAHDQAVKELQAAQAALPTAQAKAAATAKALTAAQATADTTAKALATAEANLVDEAKVYGPSVVINDTTIHAGDQLADPTIANPTVVDPMQNLANQAFLQLASAKLDTLPTGTTARWANLDQVRQDAQTMGNYAEAILVTFPDGSTTTVKGNLVVLAGAPTASTPAYLPAGAHVVNGQVVDGNGNVIPGYTVVNGQIVKTNENQMVNGTAMVTPTGLQRKDLDNGRLPQTGNQSQAGLIGLGVAAFMATFGLGVTKRRRQA